MKSRLLIFVMVLGIMAVTAGWIYESRLRPQPETAQLQIPDNIDYFLTNVKYRAIDDRGRIDYEFSSNRLEHRPLNDISLIESPALMIHQDAGLWRISARAGELQHDQELFWLRHDVLMQKSGEAVFELQAQSVRFDPANDLVSSDQPVLLRQSQSRIEANTAVFDLAEKVYRLSGTRAVYHDVGS